MKHGKDFVTLAKCARALQQERQADECDKAQEIAQERAKELAREREREEHADREDGLDHGL